MMNTDITRRYWVGGCACLGIASTQRALARPSINTDYHEIKDAQSALVKLKEGNLRFSSDKQLHIHEKKAWRSKLLDKQKPFASILGCSDSRVPPELVFDVGFGELFTIRLAGNIIAEDVVGSLQYAVAHLHTPLVIVMGHEGCGAVTAAVDSMLTASHERSHIEMLLKAIKPGLAGLDLKQERKLLLKEAVKANVLWSMKTLSSLPEAQRAIKDGRVTLVGAIYELDTGKVRFMN